MILLSSLKFPYPKIRPMQDRLMANVMRAIKNKTNLVVHAPTGLGKTIATLVPAIEYAKKNDLKVLFLTSRNTQHLLAMQTLKDIKKETPLIATDLIGRKHLCSQALPNFSAGELSEYCKLLKKEKKCSYYSTFAKSSGNLTVEGKLLMEELQNKSPLLASEMIKMCEVRNSCPYEAAIELTKSSDVIVADYQFIFNTFIRKNLLGKINRELDDIILIIDEAHNLPNRIKNQASSYLTTLMLKGAINEARKYDMNEIEEQLKKFEFILNSMSKRLKRDEQEMYITKEDFNDRLKRIKDIDEIIIAFEVAAEFIREKDNRSRIGGVANFLIEWQNQDKGYTRILSTDSEKKNKIVLAYKCLDPSIVSSPIVNNTYSTIMMSGTLTPTKMFTELIGFNETYEKVFTSPFPEDNQKLIIVPKTTTKFTRRNENEYKNIANELKKIVEAIPGNIAIFFPSYFVLENVSKYFSIMTSKTTFTEFSQLTSDERADLLDNFKQFKKVGAILLGVLGGSFSEGIDLPGENLKAVIIVGLPLQKPDLETKALIDYFDKKFSKGWDYGYLFPAFNKTLQGAGRCIRSETDKGAIIFLDERYIWNNYKRCFPETWNMKVSVNPEKELKEFFS